MDFVPRTTPPAINNSYYIKTTHGGFNRCIEIDPVTGSVLPNCTGYAWGRFIECQGVHNCRLSRGQAEEWYYKNDGYERGRTPRLGAVICWHSTRSGGHVEIVEKIYSDGRIRCSSSAYSGSRFFMETLKPPNYYRGPAYTFQGFIYNPTSFDPTPPTPTPTQKSKNRFPWVLYANKLRNRR